MTALVVGAMAPDLPQMLGFSGPTEARAWSHSAKGVVTVDLAVGMVAVVLWYAVYRRPLVDLAPDPWRGRLPDEGPAEPGCLAAVRARSRPGSGHARGLGLVHPRGRWGTEHVAALRDSYLGVPGYDWAQHSCSVLGLVIVTVAALRYLARLPEQPPRPGPLVARWALVVALAWGGLLGMGIAVLVWPWGLEAMAYFGVITTMLVAGFGATCVCLWWQVKCRWRTRREVRPG